MTLQKYPTKKRFNRPASSRLVMTSIKIANLNCIQVLTGPESSPTSPTNLGVLLMHGYGADPSQFTEITKILLSMQPSLASKRIRWIFPSSPTQDGPVGSEWFPLDMMGWMGAFMGGDLAAKLRETPGGIVTATEQIINLLGELISTTDGAGSTLNGWCIGGFSQGSMMTCSVLSRLPLTKSPLTDAQIKAREIFKGVTSPGGALILSGMPMDINSWAAGFQFHQGKNVEVLQLHGQSDMVIPFHSSAWLRDLLKTHMNVKYHTHSGKTK